MNFINAAKDLAFLYEKFDLDTNLGSIYSNRASYKEEEFISKNITLKEEIVKGVGEEILDFEVVGVKPKFNMHEENGQTAFETITKESFKK